MGYTDEELNYIYDKNMDIVGIAERNLHGRITPNRAREEVGKLIIAVRVREGELITCVISFRYVFNAIGVKGI